MAIGINYFDDPKGLIRILTNDTVYDYVHSIFLIDGRYESRDDIPEYDPDYPKDLSKIYRKIQLVQMFNKKQIDKRNRYWEMAEDRGMDYLIVVDSDEYLEIEPETFTNSLRTLQQRPEQCYPIKQYMEGVCTMSRPRLFKAPFDFRHRQSNTPNTISHGSLWKDYGKSDHDVIHEMYAWFKDHPKREPNSDNQGGIPGIALWHDKEYRSRERVIADRIYYDEVKDR